MPIGDLLAQISGDKSNPAPKSTLQQTSSVPTKRKLDNDTVGGPLKTQRNGHDVAGSERNAAVSRQPDRRVLNPTRSASKNGSVSRPASSSAPIVARGPPKKGSFAEILARGQRAQAVMGQVGKIQHKKVEKGAIKKRRDEPPLPSTSPSLKARSTAGYPGTAKPGDRRNETSNGHKTTARDSHQPVGRSAARPTATGRNQLQKSRQEDSAKKPKKAVQATTGYTGTARPKPDNIARKKDAPRGGALLNAPRHKPSKNSRYEDDYDEELDDFIEYDDDEEGTGGPRYGYDSDGSSDMEAGLADIDVEERRAENIGRREDQEEERLERDLKAAKEARKRKALEALRSKRR